MKAEVSNEKDLVLEVLMSSGRSVLLGSRHSLGESNRQESCSESVSGFVLLVLGLDPHRPKEGNGLDPAERGQE